MTPEGKCPTCGRSLDAPDHATGGHDEVAEQTGAPWHFKLLVVAAIAYLVWRFYQLFFG
jgi:hypothetical protein